MTEFLGALGLILLLIVELGLISIVLAKCKSSFLSCCLAIIKTNFKLSISDSS